VGADRPGEPAQIGGAIEPRRRVLYGRRRGRRLRPGRAGLVADALPRIEFKLPDSGPLDPRALFEPPPREVWLEVGFGAGEHLAAQAEAHPDIGFIGCEPFFDGVAKLVALAAQRRLANIRVFCDDARLLLDALPDAAIGRAFVLFPDPWPKVRHHKRRFLSREGFALLARVLDEGAELRVATDDPDYLDWILEHAASEGSFVLEMRAEVRPADWPATRYEEKALKAGRQPAYMVFSCRPRKTSASAGRAKNTP
jgi:tRNA (guanine-N7-)-methyltransferase